MRQNDAKRQRILWLFAALSSALLQLACSPPGVTSSIEGRVCTNWGAQACSQEDGNPRAECWGSNWQITEYCRERGCNTLQMNGQTVAYCGDTPPNIADTASGWDTWTGDSWAGGDTSADTAQGGDAQTFCNAWTCPPGQACTGVSGCEAPGCLPPCSAGQRCKGDGAPLCVDNCLGACFDSQWCFPSGGGVCSGMPCKTPVFSKIFVAEDLSLLQGPAAASHCPKLANSGGGLIGLSKVLGDLEKPSAAAASGGQQTYALADLGDGGWGWISARRSGTSPCTATECPVTASKWDNLQPSGNGGDTCELRGHTSTADTAGGTGASWDLSLRNSLYRFQFSMSTVQLQVSAGRTQAWLCGAVTPASVQAALSSSHSSNGLAIPSTAELIKLAPLDIDSDGNGSADAWSVAMELTLQPGQLKGWLP